VADGLICALGDHPLELDERTYFEVRGWEKPGKGLGGQSGSSLVLRERTGQAACGRCVTRLQQGLSPHQEALA
jgi:hypothetical protein